MAEWLRRRASAPVGIGITNALRSGRGAKALPVRSALLGAAVGVLGVAGALTLDAGLRDALAHPERAGVAWEGQAAPGQREAFVPAGFVPAFTDAVRRVDLVTDRAQVDRSGVTVNSGKGVPDLLGTTHGRGTTPPTSSW